MNSEPIDRAEGAIENPQFSAPQTLEKSAPTHEVVLERPTGTISAEPNPLPAVPDSSMTLRWETNAKQPELYGQEDGAPETLVSSSRSGVLEIGWIRPGKSYLFRLCDASPSRQIIDEVKVVQQAAGKLFVASETEDATPNGKIMLRWEISSPATGEIRLSEDGADEFVVCRGPSGEFEMSGLMPGIRNVFRLYDLASPVQLLDEAVVYREIAGKIAISSDPENFIRDKKATLQWEITPPAIGEICISEDGAGERKVCRGASGEFEVPGLKGATNYVFRLYPTLGRRQLLGEIHFFRAIEGKISASPNPVTLEYGSKTTLSWEISAPGKAEICVSEDGVAESLVCRGESGSYEVTGLRAGVEYSFRLYSQESSRPLLDEVTVRLSDIPWSKLLEHVRGAGRGKEYSEELAQFIGGTLSRCIHHADYPKWFRLWEELGVHVTPVHFYEPIPDLQSLDKKSWNQRQVLSGVEMNADMQRHLLCEVFPSFRDEYEQIPRNAPAKGASFYLDNGRFSGLDPLLAYCMVRHFRPRQIIEVGSGYSTLVLAQAARVNGDTELHSIEPYPPDFLTGSVPGLTSLLVKKVEEVEPSFFTHLQAGDCLFIDTSHVVRTGGDVNHLFLEVLPLLQPGVLVHVHDIFFPYDYPKEWVVEQRRFWTEQYLLQAFLTYNSKFEVLVSSGYLKANHLEELKTVFPSGDPWQGGSFWMRRKT